MTQPGTPHAAPASPSRTRGLGRYAAFTAQMVYLIVLGYLAVAYLSDPSSPLKLALQPSLGPVPIGAIWFGALGGVMISLTGIVAEHRKDWDESYALWHYSRPLVGACLAIISVLILQAGVLAVGTNPNLAARPEGSTQVPQNLLYYLIAFVVGYREETFRELIKRLTDLLLAPATPAPKPTITGLSITSGSKAGGDQVVISGSGFTGTTAVTFGTTEAKFSVDSESQITATLPAASAAGQVIVTVKGSAGSATAPFSYTN